MNISKKKLFVIIAMFAMLTTAIAFATQVFYEIPSHVSIAGIGVAVHWNIENAMGNPITTMEFGLIVPPDSRIGYLPEDPLQYLIVLVADCNGVNETVTWDSDLDPAIGTIGLEIEVCTNIGGSYADYEWEPVSSFDMAEHEQIGFRGPWASAHVGDYGYLRILLHTLEDATHGDFTFAITFTGTQI